MKHATLLIIVGLAAFIHQCVILSSPRIAIVMVIDGCGMAYFQKARPFFRAGLKKMCDKGAIFTSCCYPYAALSTGPGHTTISTGALPRDHGIIDNDWVSDDKLVLCDQDDAPEAAVFSSDETYYDYGKSPHLIMVDSIADSVMLNADKKSDHAALALSNKSRSAVCMAGNMGKAYWFDVKKGTMTTSGYYYSQMPSWLHKFNNTVRMRVRPWKLAYPLNHAAYDHVFDPSYGTNMKDPQKVPPRLAGKDHFSSEWIHNPKIFDLTPTSMEYLAECGIHAVKYMLVGKPRTGIFFISFSTLDKIGHLYGPESLEYVDGLYQLDRIVGIFMQRLQRLLKDYEVVFVLTADHGNIPMIEVLQERGFTLARRINSEQIKDRWNNEIQTTFGISDCISHVFETSISLNELRLSTLPPQQQNEILTWIVRKARSTPGIKNAWTQSELLGLASQEHDWIERFKNQIVPGRTGQIVIQLEPYVYVGKYDARTGHNSPYYYSTNVPLIWYSANAQFSHKELDMPVWVPQLAPSLAKFLEVPRPSAARYPLLPQLFTSKDSSYE